MLFSGHRLRLEENETELILYIEEADNEFSDELHEFQNEEMEEVNNGIFAYLGENFPDLKKGVVKVMYGAALICTVSLSTLLKAKAEETPKALEAIVTERPDITVWMNGNKLVLTQAPILVDGSTYIGLRDFCDTLGAVLDWEQETKRVTIHYREDKITFTVGGDMGEINGKSAAMPKTLIYHDRTMVPLRFLSENFDIGVKWAEEEKAVYLSTSREYEVITDNYLTHMEEVLETGEDSERRKSSYTEEDLYWLSRLVHAEAQSESYDGKLAVANVILNRTKSDDFPETVKGVIFDSNYGVQFTPTVNGALYQTPGEESIQAAREALEGRNNAEEVLYFLNPQKATNRWIMKNRQYAFTIGNHNFYF